MHFGGRGGWLAAEGIGRRHGWSTKRNAKVLCRYRPERDRVYTSTDFRHGGNDSVVQSIIAGFKRLPRIRAPPHADVLVICLLVHRQRHSPKRLRLRELILDPCLLAGVGP